MVPNGWENKTLETLCEPTAPITYGVLKPGDYVDGGTPLLQIKDLLNDLSDIDSLHRISPELDLEYRRSRIATNDILISLVGTVGRIGLVPEELNGANIHRNLGRIRTKNYKFLVHYLNSDIAKNKIGLSSSGSSQSALNLSVLRALKVPVPPLPEQHKIAQILSTWDRGIVITEKLIDASKQQKKALMQQLLTGKKRLVDPETGKAFEGEWEDSTLSNVCKIIKGKQLNRSTLNTTGKYPVINGGITPSGYTDSSNNVRNTITISEGGNSCGYIDYQKADFWCGGHCYSLSKVTIDTKYLYQYLKHNEQRVMSLRVGSGLPNIQKKAIESVPVLYPSEREQQKIASVLTAADKEIELLEAKLAHFKQEKKALMQQLLTGKRRVSLSS
ncbi:restriction endonuclease subunit S [Morganella morganii]|uniref:restriction endonuclease subunit S n=1 Tax=Morganella morganii TaxID=582 RepID=UPI000BBD229A|nr:restriction endonuclease subunit S [Morganella morganii]ATF54202.1 restriction endonuclease subunit S [Morganella morganii]